MVPIHSPRPAGKRSAVASGAQGRSHRVRRLFKTCRTETGRGLQERPPVD